MALRINTGREAVPPVEEDLPVEEELPIEEPIIEEPPMESMGGIVDPMVARYLGPDQRCHSCIHFDGTSICEVLAGPVEPDGVCSLFTADQMTDEPIAPMEDMPLEE